MAIFVRNVATSPKPFSLAEAAGGAATVSGSAGSAVVEPGVSPCMAEPVTRHALKPPADSFQYLTCGIDSLYFGIYVIWGEDWSNILKILENLKQKAQGSDGIIEESTPGRKYIFLPGGMPPNYRYHLKFSEYSLFLSKTEHATQSPNAYLQINSEALWKLGMEYTLDLLYADLRYLGGQMAGAIPSRIDICADFKLDSGLTLPFLQDHVVCRSRDLISYTSGDILETCYFGSAAAPIRLRIYDKGKEVLKKGTKLWFRDIWGTEDFEGVWRVELQLRREALKQFDINKTEDIWNKLGSIWAYLTTEWFSLRVPDNDRTKRRAIHPWWQDVSECSNRLGPERDIQRVYRQDSQASVEWFVSHIAGCLPSFAARLNISDYREAIMALGKRLYFHWDKKNFESEFLKRSIKLGRLEPLEGSHGFK